MSVYRIPEVVLRFSFLLSQNMLSMNVEVSSVALVGFVMIGIKEYEANISRKFPVLKWLSAFMIFMLKSPIKWHDLFSSFILSNIVIR